MSFRDVTARRLRGTGVVVALSSVAAGLGAVAVVIVPTAVLGAIGVVLLGAGVASPPIGIALILAASGAMLVVGGAIVAAMLAVFTSALALVGSRPAAPPGALGTPRLLALLVGYLALSAAIGAALSRHEFDPQQLVGLWGLQLAPLLLAFVLTRPRDQLEKLLIVVVGVAGALAILQTLAPPPPAAELGAGQAFTAFVQNRNALGILYLFAIGIVLPRIALSPRPANMALIALVAGLGLAVLATLSRSSYVAAAAMVFTFLFLRGSRVWAAVLLLLLVGAPILLSAGAGTIEDAVRRVVGTVSAGTLDASSGARLDLWQAAINGFERSPIFGVGYQQFSAQLPSLWEGSVSDLAIASRAPDYAYAHNLYLTVLSQTGLIGAVAAAGVALSIARDAARASGHLRETAWLALAAAAAASLFGEPLLVAAVSVPFLVINAAARSAREPA